MVLTLVGLSAGMLNEPARRAKGIGADIIIRPPSSSVITFSVSMPANFIPVVIDKEPHVIASAGVLLHGTDMFSYVTGVDLAQFNRLNGGFRFEEGGPFQHSGDAMVGTYYASENQLPVGDMGAIFKPPWG